LVQYPTQQKWRELLPTEKNGFTSDLWPFKIFKLERMRSTIKFGRRLTNEKWATANPAKIAGFLATKKLDC
jgi:hypothetical protein